MRLIDKDRLLTERMKSKYYHLPNGDTAIPIIDIEHAPSIDIVFCENCRECVEKGVGDDCPSGYGYLYCRRKKAVVDETDFCSWGVEK